MRYTMTGSRRYYVNLLSKKFYSTTIFVIRVLHFRKIYANENNLTMKNRNCG